MELSLKKMEDPIAKLISLGEKITRKIHSYVLENSHLNVLLAMSQFVEIVSMHWVPKYVLFKFCYNVPSGTPSTLHVPTAKKLSVVEVSLNTEVIFFEFSSSYIGKPYCETHYHQQTGSLCSGCGKPITGRCVNALDKVR